MRSPLGPRLLAQLLSWLLCVSCADKVTGEGPSVAPAVSFSIPSLGLSAATPGWPRPDRAHIRIWTTRLPVTLIADTAVTLPPAAGPLGVGEDRTVEISVPVFGATEQFEFDMELFVGTQRFYVAHGPVTAQLRPLGTAPSPSPALALSYVGPGANAVRMIVSPRDTVLTTSGARTFNAAVLDSAGVRVSAAPVTWRSSDATVATVDAVGAVTALSKRGFTYIVGRTPAGLKDSTRVRVVPPPLRVDVFGGDNQSGVVGHVLPQPIAV